MMANLFTRATEWVRNRASRKSELQKNAEKALRMKREAGPSKNIPEHQTPHQGGVRGPQVGYSDAAVGKQPTSTPNLKRSHNPRSGDA
jgi:hypothetical protein